MAVKARIGVLGAGLMGHGIAQVFALAGHEVAIYDPIAASLDQVKNRITANLRDLGDDESAVARVTPCAELAAAVRDAVAHQAGAQHRHARLVGHDQPAV